MKLQNLSTMSKKDNLSCNAEELRSGVQRAYSAAARKPMGKHPFPVGRKFAESIGYPSDLLDTIPVIAWEVFVGVSNVSLFADIPHGATVLDVGCGTGLDTIIAAKRVGADGKVIGIDFSDDMLTRARQAVEEINIGNQVKFHCVAAEELPLGDKSVDVILVNGIFNLNPKRDKVFRELARVVKDGGKVYAAEMVFTEPMKTQKVSKLSDWFA